LDKKISQYWRSIQQSLFPGFETEVGAQTSKHGQIMVALDVLEFERHIDEAYLFSVGRPGYSRVNFARAFVAKAILNLSSTRALIDRLEVDSVLFRICNFNPCKKLPCEATFSNAFADLSKSGVLDKIHAIVVKTNLAEDLVHHISRDGTDIATRERVPKVEKKLKGKRKTKKLKGKHRRIFKQLGMTLDEMIEDLPSAVGASTKRGHSWKGHKLHLDVTDFGIPVSAILTSAQVHDSQAAIPLEEMTSRRVKSLYSLMDSAYDAKEIRLFVESKNKVPLIDPANRRGVMSQLDPASRKRYAERTTVERAFSRLKDGFGLRHIKVKGHPKVLAHIMFGVLSLTAEVLVRTS
jgi:transposase